MVLINIVPDIDLFDADTKKIFYFSVIRLILVR